MDDQRLSSLERVVSLVVGLLGLVLIGVAVGILLARARRRLEAHEMSLGRTARVDRDRAPLVRERPTTQAAPSILGTAEQRMQVLWTCAASSAGAVVLVAAGAPIVGQLVLFVAMIMAAQVAVMGVVARLRTKG